VKRTTPYAVQTTEETKKLLERTYERIIAARLNADLPLISKSEAFALIVRQAAERQGITV
jgi:hypothetical protein